MKERPILFSAPMVRAILDGCKTQTRRVVKGSALEWLEQSGFEAGFVADPANLICPYGIPGDRLWVRETWQQHLGSGGDSRFFTYRATDPEASGPWRPSIFMPRDASRILLEITDVRVQRLQEISDEDARAEGISDGGCLSCGNPEPCGCSNPQPDARDAFSWLWQSIHGSDGWHNNPWVWAITFRRVP